MSVPHGGEATGPQGFAGSDRCPPRSRSSPRHLSADGCRMSPAAANLRGISTSPSELSPSDSRLRGAKLTAPRSTTILSAYHSSSTTAPREGGGRQGATTWHAPSVSTSVPPTVPDGKTREDAIRLEGWELVRSTGEDVLHPGRTEQKLRTTTYSVEVFVNFTRSGFLIENPLLAVRRGP